MQQKVVTNPYKVSSIVMPLIVGLSFLAFARFLMTIVQLEVWRLTHATEPIWQLYFGLY